MEQSDHKENILRYIKGIMSNEEKVEFEKKLETNEALADEMMSYVVNKYEDERLRLEIQKTHNHFRILRNKNLLKWAALILIFLLPAGYFFQQHIQNSGSLNTDYYADYPAQTGLRGNSSIDQSEIIRHAFQLYASDDFEEAAQSFLQASDIPDINNKSKLQLYTGISLLRTKNPEDYQLASQKFREVLSTRNEFNQAAGWFLAITQYESDDKDEAKVLFEKIATNENHYNSKKAKEILEEKY